MRSRAPQFILLFLFLSGIAAAELSVTNKWRIEQAIQECNSTDNTLTYRAYWGNSVTIENLETVCIAENFAKVTVFEAEDWLENKAPVLIKECKAKFLKNEEGYYSCLQTGVQAVTKQLTSSCKELGEEGLWETGRCEHLISYIFVAKFEEVLKEHRPLLAKAMDNKILMILCHPIAAILFLILFVADVFMLIDPGRWVWFPKVVLVAGGIILTSFLLGNPWRFLGMGAAVVISIGAIIWNHLLLILQPKPVHKKRK